MEMGWIWDRKLYRNGTETGMKQDANRMEIGREWVGNGAKTGRKGGGRNIFNRATNLMEV